MIYTVERTERLRIDRTLKRIVHVRLDMRETLVEFTPLTQSASTLLVTSSRMTGRRKVIMNVSMVRNLTPHTVVLLEADEERGTEEGQLGYGRAAKLGTFRRVAEFPSVGVARADTLSIPAGTLWLLDADGEIALTRTVFGEVQDLPAPTRSVGLIVSLITANAAAAGGRTTDDLLVVGEAVRNEEGRIIGCVGLGVV